jgi:hypothetical protein
MTFDLPPYTVTLEGTEVTVSQQGSLYAIGTWVPTGGYVRYLYDGAAGNYDWKLFDKVDGELRARTDFRPVPLLDQE